MIVWRSLHYASTIFQSHLNCALSLTESSAIFTALRLIELSLASPSFSPFVCRVTAGSSPERFRMFVLAKYIRWFCPWEVLATSELSSLTPSDNLGLTSLEFLLFCLSTTYWRFAVPLLDGLQKFLPSTYGGPSDVSLFGLLTTLTHSDICLLETFTRFPSRPLHNFQTIRQLPRWRMLVVSRKIVFGDS